MRGRFIAADWRDASIYAGLRSADRSAFAWEWLRRSPRYQAAIGSAVALPAQFGLHRFEDPSRSAETSDFIWRADVDPSVLRAVAKAPLNDDVIDLAGMRNATVLHIDRHGEHWRIGDGLRSIRLDIIHGTLRSGPVRLEYRIGGLTHALPVVLTLRRWLALACTGRWPKGLYPVEARADRWIMMLRTHDALATGASHRDIAASLFGEQIIGARWRSSASSYRLRVQRLVSAARVMTDNGWKALFGCRDASAVSRSRS